ncbi:hypothetical protein F5Y04DRAFT_248991 [Hypomontagnella monticulosa]|nr:hypothetical protein F5Y04DRAFT_248991 [Hypomontagnella monticulosa]
MADAPGSDRTLLERLNALKPSTVNLDRSSESVPASTIEPAKPLSREDALSDRLKSLRNQSDHKVSATSGPETSPRGRDTIIPSSPDQRPQPQPGPKTSGTATGAPQISSIGEINEDADPLLFTDDQTLEELLADLESDQPWLDEVAAEEEEHRRVMSLLEDLRTTSSANQDLGDESSTKKTSHDDEDEGSSDDDSEGDQMTREADDILAQAVDEAELENANRSPPSESKPNSPDHIVESVTQSGKINQPASAQESNESDPLNLPAVPTNLRDPPDPPDPSKVDDDDFAASITSRMAALKVNTPVLPSVPTKLGELTLPTAPTFAPADRPAPGLIKRFGFTDEDQKTWCTVCLEDGAIRCIDCDGDVYCARCWKEMHVGPSAGYDERGHRWEKFVRGH